MPFSIADSEKLYTIIYPYKSLNCWWFEYCVYTQIMCALNNHQVNVPLFGTILLIIVTVCEFNKYILDTYYVSVIFTLRFDILRFFLSVSGYLSLALFYLVV